MQAGDAPHSPPDGETSIERLVRIMQTLRGEGGCPWDREQSLETLKPYLVEETHEVLDAIDLGDRKLLEEELGDLLLQVVFQAQICSEEGSFTFDDVAANISDKLVRRHPHVFGDLDVADSAEVLKNWEAIKKEEKAGERTSATDGVPRSMPALRKADKLQKKVARLGFDWRSVEGVVAKVEEELAEVKEALAAGDEDQTRRELGDLFFAGVNLSRFLGHNAEEVLDEAIVKFTDRFKKMEEALDESGKDIQACSLEELDALWEAAKAGEGSEV